MQGSDLYGRTLGLTTLSQIERVDLNVAGQREIFCNKSIGQQKPTDQI